MSDTLRQAYKLAETGEKDKARIITARLLQQDPQNAEAWAIMSDLVDSNKKAIDCLRRVLRYTKDQNLRNWTKLRLIELGDEDLTPPPMPSPFYQQDPDAPTPPPGPSPFKPHLTSSLPPLPELTEGEAEAGQNLPDFSGPETPMPPPKALEKPFDTGGLSSEDKPDKETDSPPAADSEEQKRLSFLEAPATGRFEVPEVRPPLPDDNWLEWDEQATGVLKEEEPSTKPLPVPQDDGIPTPVDMMGGVANLRQQVRSQSQQRELLPGFESGVQSAESLDSIDLDYDEQEDEEERRLPGCLRPVVIIVSMVLIALIAGYAYLAFSGSIVPPEAVAQMLPFNVSQDIDEGGDPEEESGEEESVAAETEEEPSATPTDMPTPTATPTAGPTDTRTGLPLLGTEPGIKLTLRDIEEDAEGITAISTSTSGRIAIASNRGVYVFNEGGAQFALGRTGATHVAFSPADDDILAANDQNDVVVWNAGSVEAITRLTGIFSPISALEFSPDGEYLLVGSVDGTVTLWSVDSFSGADGPQIYQQFQPDGNPVRRAMWFGDSEQFLVFTALRNARVGLLGIYPVQETDSPNLTPRIEPIRLIEVPSDVTSIALSPVRPSGTQVAWSTDSGLIRVLNASSGSIRTLAEPPPVSESTTTPTPSAPGEPVVLPQSIVGLSFSSTGLFAARYGDGSVGLWAGETFAPVGVAQGGPVGTAPILWSGDGSELYSVNGTDVYVFEFGELLLAPPSGTVGIGPGVLNVQETFSLEAENSGLALFFSEDNNLLSLGLPTNRIVQYDVSAEAANAGSITLSTQGPLIGTLEAMDFDTDKNLVAAALANGTIVVWNVESGEVLTTLAGLSPGDVLTRVAFSNDGTRIAAGAIDGDAFIWSIVPPAGLDEPDEFAPPIMELQDGHLDVFSGMEWSPDDSLLATSSSDDAVILWDVETGDIVDRLTGHQLGVGALAFSEDGLRLASSERASGNIFVWDMNTGEPISILRGHVDVPTVLDFRPGQDTLLSGGSDGSVYLWQYNTTEFLIASPVGVNPPVSAGGFSEDGSTIAVTFDGGSAKVWEFRE